MIANVFVTILLIGLTAVSAQNCGSVLQGTLIPDGSNCGAYFTCNNGVLQSNTCPGNYGFDPNAQMCSPTYSCGNQISINQPNWVYPGNNGGYYPGNINNGYPYPYPINNGPYPINNGPYPINNGPYPINNGPYPINNIPYPINNGPYQNYPYPGGYPYQTINEPNSISNPCYGQPNGAYVAYSCSQFYFCNQGQATLSSCPSGYTFSTLQNTCVASNEPCYN